MLHPFQVCFCSCLKWRPKGKRLLSLREHLEVRNACLAAFSLFPFHALQQKPFTVLGQLLAIPPLKVLPDPWPHDAAYTRSGFQSLVSRLWGSFISPQEQQDPGRFQCTTYLRTMAQWSFQGGRRSHRTGGHTVHILDTLGHHQLHTVPNKLSHFSHPLLLLIKHTTPLDLTTRYTHPFVFINVVVGQ